MVLTQLQHLLGGIYDVDVAVDVYDYLVTDRGRLPPGPATAPADEQLLLQQNADELALSLFLEPRVLERLAAENPLEALHGGNLADYLTALEGVSHFVCVTWNASHDKSVSLLELEMQAEVDKYVTALCLMRAQSPERVPRELHPALFERARVDTALAGERAAMYRTASDYAARFCRYLYGMIRNGEPHGDARMRAELRRFYRLSNTAKLEHIQRRA